MPAAFAQEVELKDFTGYGGSGNPPVWEKTAEQAITSAKNYACQSARSKARKAGFTQETGEESHSVPSPKYNDKYGYIISKGTAGCTVTFAKVVGANGLVDNDDEDQNFRQSVEQELLRALIPNFPSVSSVAIRLTLRQALNTGVGKQLLDVLRKFTPSQRQRAAYRAVDKLEKRLRGITAPKLKDIEDMLSSMASELTDAEFANSDQPSSQYDDVWDSMGVADNDNTSGSDPQQLIESRSTDSEQRTINEENFYKKWGGSAEIYPENITDEHLKERKQLEKQKLEKRPQADKPPVAKIQPTRTKLRTFKMHILGESNLVTNELPDEFFGEYLISTRSGLSRERRFVINKNGRTKFYNEQSRPNQGWGYQWGARVKDGEVDWRTGCGNTDSLRKRESVTIFFDGDKEFVGCLYRNYKPLNNISCGHVLTTSEIWGTFLNKC